MKFELFIFLMFTVFVTKGQETTFSSLSDATKEQLLKLVEVVRFLNDRADEIVQTIEFQMKSFNASANLNLAENEKKITDVLDRLSNNKEYKKCIDGERIHLRIIGQKSRTDVKQCLWTGVLHAQALRNNTVQPFDKIRLNNFVEKCIIKEEQSGCTEQEAAVIKEEAILAFKQSYENLYKAGGELEPLAKRTIHCVNISVNHAKTEMESFLKVTLKKCVEAK